MSGFASAVRLGSLMHELCGLDEQFGDFMRESSCLGGESWNLMREWFLPGWRPIEAHAGVGFVQRRLLERHA